MNKAFTKDDDGAADEIVPPRAPLPAGVPNYVTPRGLALLRDELRRLESERAALADAEDSRRERARVSTLLAQLAGRLATVVLVEQSPDAGDVARFGAIVEVLAAGGSARTFRIVGVDEADGEEGRIAFTSPVARALIGKCAGDVVVVETPRGNDELEVRSVHYGRD